MSHNEVEQMEKMPGLKKACRQLQHAPGGTLVLYPSFARLTAREVADMLGWPMVPHPDVSTMVAEGEAFAVHVGVN